MIIVIGATGFIGVNTVEKLIKEGKKVIAAGRNKQIGKHLENIGADFIELDITNQLDFQKLPKNNVEGVILLAGLLPANAKVNVNINENADEYIKVNVLGTINVLEYCRKNKIKKIISTSSYADVFNSWKKGIALKETEPRNFKYTGDHAVYVISKNTANDIMEYYNQQHKMNCIIFRLPPVYGVGPHSYIYVNGTLYKSGIQSFIENAIQGNDIEIWGDPHLSRDIVYVKDVAEAFYLALESNKAYGLYNITSGTELELEEQVKIIIEVFGNEKKKSKIIYKSDKSNNTPSFLFDINKAKIDFGFVPKYKLYKDMMIDYKKELKSGRFDIFMEIRRKQ